MVEILNTETTLAPVSSLIPHPQNPNTGDVDKISESLVANGFYGTIVAQRSTGRIIKGNHTYLAAVKLGAIQVPVSFVDVSDERALKILIADNYVAQFGHRDQETIAQMLKEMNEGPEGLLGSGYTQDEFDALIEELNGGGDGSGGKSGGPDDDGLSDNYERKVDTPIYEPKRDAPPPIETLADFSKALELTARIDSADIPENLKRFLIAAANRHVVFDYEEIAEFYSHADAKVQSLFEESALVIIDFEAAIENGFAKLVGSLAEAYDKDAEERIEEDESEDED
jgi:hypothetical protein